MGSLSFRASREPFLPFLECDLPFITPDPQHFSTLRTKPICSAVYPLELIHNFLNRGIPAGIQTVFVKTVQYALTHLDAAFHWTKTISVFRNTLSSIPGLAWCTMVHILLSNPSGPGAFLAFIWDLICCLINFCCHQQWWTFLSFAGCEHQC